MIGLTFAELQEKSVTRCARWHTADTEPWSGADWSNAMCGEAGEAANVVKKLRRIETRTGDARKASAGTLRQMLADELGDVVAYAVLVADHYGIDLGQAVAIKFNAVSDREGFPERLPVPGWERPTCLNDGGCDGWSHSLRCNQAHIDGVPA